MGKGSAGRSGTRRHVASVFFNKEKMTMRTVRAAAIQARAEEVGSEKGFEHKILRLTQQAVEDFGAELLVFPEDLCLWLVEWNEHPRALDLQAGSMLLARVARRATDPAV